MNLFPREWALIEPNLSPSEPFCSSGVVVGGGVGRFGGDGGPVVSALVRWEGDDVGTGGNGSGPSDNRARSCLWHLGRQR